MLYLRPTVYRAVNTFHLGYENQSFCYVGQRFYDKYKTRTMCAECTGFEC